MKILSLLLACAVLLFPLMTYTQGDELPVQEGFVSVNVLQKLNLHAAFEAVYTIALEQGTLDTLPTSFFTCLTQLREGNERVTCADFIEALAVVLKTLVVLRKIDRYTLERPCCCQDQVRRLEDELLEVFTDFGDRIERLEKICGVIVAAE
ncbi:MAG: hypothetical protein M1549_00775 [Candidatus Dependentiae bacterium]|nr:hypothetical protein [Candidatus Dependentiae bacterium]